MQTDSPDPNEIVKISSTFVENEVPLAFQNCSKDPLELGDTRWYANLSKLPQEICKFEDKKSLI